MFSKYVGILTNGDDSMCHLVWKKLDFENKPFGGQLVALSRNYSVKKIISYRDLLNGNFPKRVVLHFQFLNSTSDEVLINIVFSEDSWLFLEQWPRITEAICSCDNSCLLLRWLARTKGINSNSKSKGYIILDALSQAQRSQAF